MADIGGIQQNATQRMQALGPNLPGAHPTVEDNVRTLYGLSPSTTYAANQVAVSPDIMQAAGFQLQQNSLGHSFWVPAGGNAASTVFTLNSGGQTDDYQVDNTNPSLTPSPYQPPATPNAPTLPTPASQPVGQTLTPGVNATYTPPGGTGQPLGGGPLPIAQSALPAAPGHLIGSTLPAPRAPVALVQSKQATHPTIRRLASTLAAQPIPPKRPTPTPVIQPGGPFRLRY